MGIHWQDPLLWEQRTFLANGSVLLTVNSSLDYFSLILPGSGAPVHCPSRLWLHPLGSRQCLLRHAPFAIGMVHVCHCLLLGEQFPTGLLHSVHLTSRDTNGPCSKLSFFQRCLYSEQPWNVEKVSLSGTTGRLAYRPTR